MLFDIDHHVTVEAVLTSLKKMRVPIVSDEYQLQSEIANCLTASDIPFSKEFRAAPRVRFDFLIPDGIVIEVKRGPAKPNQTQLSNQIARYAELDMTKAFIVVVDRNVQLSTEFNGKPCVVLGLNKLWGLRYEPNGANGNTRLPART